MLTFKVSASCYCIAQAALTVKWKETVLLPLRNYQFIQCKTWCTQTYSPNSLFGSLDLDFEILAFIQTFWIYVCFLGGNTVSGSIAYENLSREAPWSMSHTFGVIR